MRRQARAIVENFTDHWVVIGSAGDFLSMATKEEITMACAGLGCGVHDLAGVRLRKGISR
jgi:hypothetical protein